MSQDQRIWSAATIFARVTLAAGFLSAAADRFGVWGKAGTNQVGWGNFETFTQYVQTLALYLPAKLVIATARPRRRNPAWRCFAFGSKNTVGCSRRRRNTGRVRRVDVHLRRLRDTAECIGFHRCRSCATSHVGTARKLHRQPRPSARVPNCRTGHGETSLIPTGMCNRLSAGPAGLR
jgi:hypothetical protein